MWALFEIKIPFIAVSLIKDKALSTSASNSACVILSDAVLRESIRRIMPLAIPNKVSTLLKGEE